MTLVDTPDRDPDRASHVHPGAFGAGCGAAVAAVQPQSPCQLTREHLNLVFQPDPTFLIASPLGLVELDLTILCHGRSGEIDAIDSLMAFSWLVIPINFTRLRCLAYFFNWPWSSCACVWTAR